MPKGRRVRVLLVEDNPGDVRLTAEALRDETIEGEFHVVSDGVEAMDFLRHERSHAESPRPDLVLLDLNLPKKDGSEVLAEMKASTDLRSIPVVVLTTSQADEDIVNAYHLNANCYISKPVDLERFIKVVSAIESFWLTIVKLPSE